MSAAATEPPRAGWRSTPLKAEVTLENGRAYNAADWKKEGYPIIRIQNLKNPLAEFNYFQGDPEAEVPIRSGDLVFSWSGSKGTSFGPHIWRGEFGVLNQHIFKVVMNPNSQLRQDFLYFALKFLTAAIEDKAYGLAALVHVRKGDLESTPIPLPPLPEQKKIAHILSTVQRAIEAQERIIQTTTELKKALMHKLFTEGLPRRSPSAAGASAKEAREGGPPRHERQKQTEIGPVPESWEVVKVQDLVDREILDKPIDGNHGEIHPKVSDFVPEGIPFIMASDLKGGLVDLKTCNFLTKERADRLRKGFSLPGDVLISHKATIGETAIVPDVEYYIMLTPQVTYYRVLDHDAMSNEYLRCYFDSPAFQKPLKTIAGDGSTRAYIGITKQRDLPVILPQIDVQRELANISSCLDGKIRQAIAKKNAFTALFGTLLHELMTAKTRVHELELQTLLPA